MSHDEGKNLPGRARLGDIAAVSAFGLLLIGAASLIAAILWARFAEPSFRRFYFAYLINFSFFLSISLGAIFFVLIQHLTRAGWSVGVRRLAEILGCAMPVLAILALPIVGSVLLHDQGLYSWADHHAPAAEGHDPHAELLHAKAWYLNAPFFVVRCVIYFVVWSVLGVWYWRQSTRQDQSGDPLLSTQMQMLSPPATLIFALTLTFGSIDLLMSLDPAWFSTMFPVYFFSGCAVGIFATLIVLTSGFQKLDYLEKAITIEHFHDMGKFLFAFTFFWGYIAFSQFMLLWYANIPEETGWLVRRGMSSALPNGWTPVVLVMLFGHLLIPFAGLLSRHVKRVKAVLTLWAAWMLLMHWIDIYWLVMPEFDGTVSFGPVEVFSFIGIGGIYAAALLWIAGKAELSAVGDPRAVESLIYENP